MVQSILPFLMNDEFLVDAMPIILFAGPLEYSFSIANSWIRAGL